MDLAALLANPDPSGTRPRVAKSQSSRADPDYRAPVLGTANDGRDLDEIVWRTSNAFVDRLAAKLKSGAALSPVIASNVEAAGEEGEDEDTLVLHFPIRNAARSVGARLSGEIARRMAVEGFPAGRVVLHFHGVAGQSFGAFCNKGMKLVLRGEAHDYVGKSMHGGEIVLSPQTPPSTVAEDVAKAAAALTHNSAAPFAAASSGLLSVAPSGPRTNVIAGNTCLYGATGGRFFAAGRAGERFAVRNSGATAVVEGTGDHACEYMTNGTVVVLGSTGRNFGAGMSGGEAFVLDISDTFQDRYNSGMIEVLRVGVGSPEEARVRALVVEHVRETGSAYGAHVLAHWDEARDLLWRVKPNATPIKKDSQALMHVPNWSSRANKEASAESSLPLTLVPLLTPPKKAGKPVRMNE